MEMGRPCVKCPGQQVDYRRLTEWQPRTGKRKRGRQKKRWRDDITAHMGTATWTRVARERDKWKFYEEGFVQQMDEL